jgi:hypothetical protein
MGIDGFTPKGGSAAARPLRGEEHKEILSPLDVWSQAKPDESVGTIILLIPYVFPHGIRMNSVCLFHLFLIDCHFFG